MGAPFFTSMKKRIGVMTIAAIAPSLRRRLLAVLISWPKRFRSCQTRPPMETSPTLMPMSARVFNVPCIVLAIVK